MADETQAPEAGAVEQQQQAAPQVDLSNIEEAIGRFDGRFNAIEQALQTREQAPAEEADPYADAYGYAADLGLNVPQPDGQDDTAALRALADLSRQQARSEYEQRFNPELQTVQRELQEMRAQNDLRELQSQYPKLSEPDVHNAIVEQLQNVVPPGVPVTKQMVTLAYKAWEADQMATGKGSEAAHAELENPAGAGPEGSEPSWSQKLLQSQGAGDKGTQFWGFNAL